MQKKIVISNFNNTAAILYNSKIQEIITINHDYQVNDIYLGKIQKIFKSINAAFVDLGNNQQSGFIHLNDLKSLKKNYRFSHISDVLSVNQLILVQIVKEPTLNKGPRLTANLNLFGRYLVLMPFRNTINISRRIYDQNERSYLQALAILLKPATMGLLIRASASGVNEGVLLEDLRILKQHWFFIQKLVILSSTPCLLYKDEDLVKKIIRDFYENNINSIITDSSYSLSRIRYYLNRWSCIQQNSNIKLQVFKQSESILDRFDINSTIVNALKPKVSLSMGGYLFIETYEAFTIIDVNSGSFNKTNNSREAILKTNCYAATEVAYQIRVRNINGIIIIDFIDMESHRDQLQLLEHFARVLGCDNAKPQIIQLSKLGLVEITRRRREQSLFELFYNKYKSYNVSSFNSLKPRNKSHNLIYKGINHLFFNTFFGKTIYFYKYLMYSQNKLRIVQKLNYLNPPFIFIVSLKLYSQVISSSFQSR